MLDSQTQPSTNIISKKKKNVFLLGSQDEYRILKTWSKNNSNSHFYINGWFHDKDIPASSDDLIRKYEEMANNGSVDHFLLDPSDMDPEMLQASIDWAESRGSRIHLIQSGTTTMTSKLDKMNRFGPFAAVRLRQEPLTLRRNQIKKRIFDLSLSVFVVFGILWWFYPLIGLIIKLTSRGPIVISQDRIGIDGIRFMCMKFRTMVSDKSAEKGYSHLTSKDDHRITLIGKILRKTNLDELPQFINVLFGYMSVVGPRPHMVSEDREIADEIDKYRIRRFVRPGITGLAAINGYRGGTENLDLMQKRIDQDIEYIENWSLWLDIRISIITFWQMLTFRTGAY